MTSITSPVPLFLRLAAFYQAPSRFAYCIGLFTIALAYTIAGLAGLQLAYTQHGITLVWPPTGIAVAVLLRAGYRYWPGVFVGAVILNLSITSWWAAIGVGIGNTLAPVFVVMVLQHLRFQRTIESQYDVLLLFFVSLVGMLISAINGVFWLNMCGAITLGQSNSAFLMWWLGDSAGVFVFAPTLLAVSQLDLAWAGKPRRALKVLGEFILMILVLVLSLQFPIDTLRPWQIPLMFLPGLYLIWIAIRLRVWLSSLFMIVYVIAGVIGATQGNVAINNWSKELVLSLLWTWMICIAGTMLMLSVLHGSRERTIALLNRQVRRYRALAENTPAIVVRFLPDLTITYLNGNGRKFFGLEADSLTGVSIDQFVRGEELVKLLEILRAQEDHTPLELRQTDSAGDDRWVRWFSRAILSDEGQILDYHAVGLDVTEQRQAEEDRRAFEQQMFHAQKLESLGLMAGGVAHDFNNILTSVLGHAEIATDMLPADSPVQEHISQLVASSRRAADLTRQLLAYAGRGQLSMRPHLLNTVIRDTANLVMLSIPKKVMLNLDLSPDLPPILGDETQLRQVLMNLIVNAGEAIGDRAGTITVTTRLHVPQDPEVHAKRQLPPFLELRIRDTGAGMTADVLVRVFDPFFTTKFTGRGLGLAAVQGIIRGHGGVIEVRSFPDQGTEFFILLPVSAEPISDARSSGSITPISLPVAPTIALIVDDEETVRTVAEYMLIAMGWEVLTASNGREGLDVLNANRSRIGVIILDLTMPVMDGLETLAELRKTYPRMAVVLCTGYNRDVIPQLPADEPAVLLFKPFRQAELKKAVRQATGTSTTE